MGFLRPPWHDIPEAHLGITDDDQMTPIMLSVCVLGAQCSVLSECSVLGAQ